MCRRQCCLSTRPEHRNIVNVMRSIETEFRMYLDGEGDGASVSTDIQANIAADIEFAITLGLLEINARGEVVCADTGDLLKIQFKMDACGVWKGVQQTSIAYVFVNASTNPNSPQDTTEFCVFEGDDHWDSVALHAAQTLVQINAIIENPILLLPSLYKEGMPLVSVCLDVYLGADLSNAGDMLCVKGCNCSHPCTQCKQPKEKMCSKERTAARTLEEIKALAHVEAGLVCPACKKMIVDKEKADLDALREVLLAKPGDEPPSSQA
jgi:hypothetical protein